MADILIRMEMPTTCADCHDADLPTAIAWLGAKCPWAHGIIDPGVYDLRHGRHPNCPLHELPEHGDLIDRDYIQRTLKPYSKEDEQVEVTLGTAKRLIQNAINAPVIVPSNKEETE